MSRRRTQPPCRCRHPAKFLRLRVRIPDLKLPTLFPRSPVLGRNTFLSTLHPSPGPHSLSCRLTPPSPPSRRDPGAAVDSNVTQTSPRSLPTRRTVVTGPPAFTPPTSRNPSFNLLCPTTDPRPPVSLRDGPSSGSRSKGGKGRLGFDSWLPRTGTPPFGPPEKGTDLSTGLRPLTHSTGTSLRGHTRTRHPNGQQV